MYKMILRQWLVFGLIILAMFVTENQGQHKKKRKNKVVKLDPATAKVLQMLQNKKEMRNLRATVGPSANPSSRQLVGDYIYMRFKSEIVKLFTHLPQKQRCNAINNIMNVTQCDNELISNILAHNNIVRNFKTVKCSAVRTSRCSLRKDSANVLRVFWNQMGKLFQGLPVPFQCSIVNKISSSSPSSKRRKLRQSPVLKGKTPRITLQMVEKQLKKLYPSLDITLKCSKVWKPLKKKVPLKSPASLVNVTVQLTRGMRRKAWEKRLRKKAFKIYNIYYKYTMKEQRRRPLSFFGSRQKTGLPLLKKKDVRLTVIRMVKVSRFAVSVVFALEYKRHGTSQFVKVSPAKQIIKAVNITGAVAMRRLFDAQVLELTVAKDDHGHVDAIWTSSDMVKAKELFPRYLISYYRLGIDRLARCLVMLYISTTLQRDLRPVELYYNSHKYLPKKYFCSSTRRTTGTNVSVGSFYRINETDYNPFSRKPKESMPTEKLSLIDTINKRLNITFTLPPSEEPQLSDDYEDDGPLEERSSSRSMSPLEIGLVAVLVVLCIAIVSFTIYCVVFAFRRRRPPPTHQQQPAKTAFELFRKIEEAKKQNTMTENEAKELNSNASRLGVMVEQVRKPETLVVGLNQNVYSIDPMRPNQGRHQDVPSNDVVQEDVLKTVNCTDIEQDENEDIERNDNDGDDDDIIGTNVDDDDKDINQTKDNDNNSIVDADIVVHKEGDNDDDDDKDINQTKDNDNNSIVDADIDDVVVHKEGDNDDDVFYKQTSPDSTNSVQDLTRNSPTQRNSCTKSINQNRPRTLKESCGEIRLISDNNHLSRKSLSNSGDLDPVIKNNTMTVVVVIDDQSFERESST